MMNNAIGSKSVIRNFMANASRTTCNEYLYGALQDADEALQRFEPMKVIKTETCSQACPICKHAVNWNYCSNCGQALKY